MAKVTIENAEVTRHLGDKGFIAEVRYKTRNGEEKVEKWTVWGKLAEIGQVFTITGDLTIKTEEFDGAEGKVRYARGHVNNPVFSFEVPFGASAPAAKDKKGHAALNDVWPSSTPGGIDEEAPF
jgi:hypothetical protein